MAEKKIFVYKRFLSLYISIFFCKHCNPSRKSSSLSIPAVSSKNRDRVKLLFENLVGGSNVVYYEKKKSK